MSDSSMVYGCADSYLSSLADQHCTSLLSMIPDCDFTDASCCTSVYDLNSAEAKCLTPYATCMDYAAWTNDASIGLAACTAAIASITLTESTSVPTDGPKPSSTKSATTSPTITPGPTATGSASAVNTQSATTRNAGGKVEISLYKVGVLGLMGMTAVLGAWGGM
ncbi:hypothetical protein IFR05_004538 [Cadophora sp. M221]|nr:hypothetical protein IFR05_004538 [Cadophora sp. M221]